MVPWAREEAGAVVLAIYAQPRAPRSKVVGPFDGQLKVALAAPPVDGEANAELLRFLAKCLALPLRQLELLSGEGSRRKRVRVVGATVSAVAAALS